MIPQTIRAMISSILFLVVASPLLSPLDAVVSLPSAFAQASEPSNGIIKLAYTKLGVAGGAYQQILYDSSTNSLGLTNISAKATTETEAGRTEISSSQGLSQSQSNKKLTETDQANLRQTITNSGLFQANGTYPPDTSGAQDYTLYILSVTMDNKPRTVIWSSTSSGVPSGLASIATTIDDIASR